MEVVFSSFNWLSVCRFPIALVDEAALALPALSGDVLAVQEDALPALLALLSPKDRLAVSTPFRGAADIARRHEEKSAER